MDAKKISFSFSKKPSLLVTPTAKQVGENKIELIKCFEGKEIKLVEEQPAAAPLVIPLKEGQKTSAALASLMKRRAVLLGEPDEPLPEAEAAAAATTNGNGTPAINETLEKRAARELLAQAQRNGDAAENTNDKLVLPVLKPDELPLDGAKQSTIDDYESIPIEHFGRAMLRGMGWVEPPKQKKAGDAADDMPFVRPKGMGLGADKALKAKPLLVPPEKNELLEIRKQAYVRILGGKYKDQYGQIEGFDDHGARIIVKLAIGGTKEAFNEFLCQPVSKKEYAQYGKCINTAKYEEYKKMENEHGQIIIIEEDFDKKPHFKKEEGNNIKSERWRTKERDDERGREEKPSSTKRRAFKQETRDDERHQTHSRVKQETRGHSDDVKQRDTSNNRTRRDDDRERVKRHERDDEQRYDSRKLDAREQSKRKSREREREREREHSNSHESRVPSAGSSSHRRQQYTDDTSASSGTDSDSDSAYERKHKKKSNHNHHKSKSKAKSKKKSSKKVKHRKQKQRAPSDTDATDDSASSSSDDEDPRRHRQHKKKTKKSKKPRSRTRSRSHSHNARR